MGGPHYSDRWAATIHMNSTTPIDELIGITDAVPGGDDRDSTMESLLDEVVEACSAYIAVPQISQATALDFVKLNPIDADTNRYIWDDVTYVRDISGVQGTGSKLCAPQLAIVATLHTARNRGRGSKGRIYMPLAFTTVQADGRLSDEDVSNAATHAQGFLNDLNNWQGIDLPGSPEVCIYSITGRSTNLVTGVSVGHVIDTMRSRRNSIDEGPREILTVS